jgi:hypothetical protein
VAGDDDIEVRDVSPPAPSAAVTAERAVSGPRLAPRKVIQTYDDDDWEVFIEEWATSLLPSYRRVCRFGGAGDRGVDVAGFRSDLGFEGDWDGFQGKHYAQSLSPAIAWPEMLKVFLLPIRKPKWRLPTRYSFVSPRGVTTSLAHLLASPSELREKFIEQVELRKSKPFKDLGEDEAEAVLGLARTKDFAFFGSVEVLALIDQHSTTAYHAVRFGGGLPVRPAPTEPPAELSADEMVYVRKLADVYRERYATPLEISAIQSHMEAGGHFQRQRECFFRAEALRNFARDSVPPGTFEGLQNEVFDAVIETVKWSHPDGYTRLHETLRLAVTAQITANALIHVTEPGDRRGICHQLANDDRLTWVVDK